MLDRDRRDKSTLFYYETKEDVSISDENVLRWCGTCGLEHEMPILCYLFDLPCHHTRPILVVCTDAHIALPGETLALPAPISEHLKTPFLYFVVPRATYLRTPLHHSPVQGFCLKQ